MYEELYKYVETRTKELGEYLEKINKVGNIKCLNTPDRRFIKSEIIERALVKHVFTDFECCFKKGYDLKYRDIKISVKSLKDSFNLKAKNTKPLIISNLNGKNVKTKLKDVDFDILLIISTSQKSAGLVNADLVKEHTVKKHSQFIAKLPFSAIHFLNYPKKLEKEAQIAGLNNRVNALIIQNLNEVYGVL